MFKSLRWRLQVWHAFVLLAVISSFGGIVHRLHWETRLQQTDAELDRAANKLWRLPGRPPGGRPPRQEEPRPEGLAGANRDQIEVPRPGALEIEIYREHREELRSESDSVTGTRQGQTAGTRSDGPESEINRENPDRPAGQGRSRQERFLAGSRRWQEELDQLFTGDDDSPYFVIWNDKGDVIHSSKSAPRIDYPNLGVQTKRIVRDRFGDHPYREVINVRVNSRNQLVGQSLVGRSLEKDLAAHHQSGLFLIVTGIVILAAGVLGGGWLSSRAIRPINDMTAAAESISALNLSERINVKDTDSELGQLAVVLNRTFDRLQSAFERQRQFTADASHELRTPLSVIATHTELALSRPRSNEDYRAALETCQRASQRMKSLIEALLLLARFETGNPTLNLDPLDLESLVQDCLELVQSLASERNILIESTAQPCTVSGDWNRLSQVVTNLLINSIRYNVDGGCIRVSTRIENGNAVIAVADSGIGIAEDELPKIFDRFYQVDKARSHAEGSCGLGLSISKTIVEAHGGTIVVNSQLNVGTTIEVRLPLGDATLSSEADGTEQEKLISV